MDFFEQQDRARRQTKRLIALFALGVMAVVALTTLAVWGALMLANPATDAALASAETQATRPFDASRMASDPAVLGTVAGATLLLILGGSALRLMQLGSDGSGVAERLGGKLIDHDTADPDERRLLNVVEEMAIASGTPVPPVYVMEGERGINAFAAGTSPENAVIGATRGTVTHLSRDELQGVVGHEFSHILSGDMRINLRLIGVLAGILVIGHIGALMMRSAFYVGATSRVSSRERGGGGAAIAIWALGGALAVIGFVGVFFGSWIKSAVSRQREHLADAASVQFTRNPEGIAGALKKIGGFRRRGRVRAPSADEASHMFFTRGVREMFATHPPLEKRIRAIDPSWDGAYTRIEDEPAPEPEKAEPERTKPTPERFAHAVALSAAAMIGQPTDAHLTQAAKLYSAIPEPLRRMAGDPFSARAVLSAMLISRFEETQKTQLEAVRARGGPGLEREIRKAAGFFGKLTPELRLPLVELSSPSLKRLSADQAEAFRGLVDELIAADRKTDLFEWCVRRLILRSLGGERKRGAVHYYNARGLEEEAEKVLGWLAEAGHSSLEQANQAYALGAELFGMEAGLMAKTDWPIEEIDEAVDKLALAAPKIKKKMVHACAAVVSYDKTVTPQEAELFRAIVETLGVPAPPVLPGQTLV